MLHVATFAGMDVSTRKIIIRTEKCDQVFFVQLAVFGVHKVIALF